MLLAVVPLFVILWCLLTVVVHHVRRRQWVWRFRLGGHPKLPKAKHRYFDRKGNWRGPGFAETLKRLGEPDGLDWIKTVETVEGFFRSGQFNREKAIGALNRLEGAAGPVGVVSWPGGPEVVERPRPPRVDPSSGAPTTTAAIRHEDGEYFIPRANPGRPEMR